MWGDPSDNIKFNRDTEVIEIPNGDRLIIEAGTHGLITQALGGTFTVVTQNGQMVRVLSKDADAIGREAAPAPAADELDSPDDVEQAVWDQLRTCYDPEIPVNIADLGLIYGCTVTPLPDGNNAVEVQMTLTAPGCGMGDVLKAEVESKLLGIPTVEQANVEVVFDPPWDMSMMPEAAKLQLGIF
jgi:probable FeS assembly SUF system protein SufT